MATTARSKNINGRVARRVILAPANTRALPPSRARISLVHIKRRFIQQPPPARKSNSGRTFGVFRAQNQDPVPLGALRGVAPPDVDI